MKSQLCSYLLIVTLLALSLSLSLWFFSRTLVLQLQCHHFDVLCLNCIIVFDKLNSPTQTAIPLKLNVKQHDTPHSERRKKTKGTNQDLSQISFESLLIEFRVILRAHIFLDNCAIRNRQAKNVITETV